MRERAFQPLQWFVRNLWIVGAITLAIMLVLLWWLLRLALTLMYRLERQIEAVGQGHRERIELDTHAIEIRRYNDGKRSTTRSQGCSIVVASSVDWKMRWSLDSRAARCLP